MLLKAVPSSRGSNDRSRDSLIQAMTTSAASLQSVTVLSALTVDEMATAQRGAALLAAGEGLCVPDDDSHLLCSQDCEATCLLSTGCREPSQQEVLLQRLCIFDLATILFAVAVVAVSHFGFYPTCRPFVVTDPTISRPYHENTFPVYSLFIMAPAPVLIYAAAPRWRPHRGVGLSRPRWWGRRDELYAYALMQLTSVVLALALGEVCKTYAGRLRPDFVSRAASASDCNITAMSFGWECCHQDASVVEGRRSFPSGHAITAFSAIVPLCLFLTWRLGIAFGVATRARTQAPIRLWRFGIAWLPIWLPVIVAVSRTVDNRHHFVDVVTGGLIGTATGVAAFVIMMRRLSAAAFVGRGGCSDEVAPFLPATAPRPAAPR